MIRTNTFTIAIAIGLIWLIISAALAYDCSEGTTLVASSAQLTNDSGAILGTATTCELSRIQAVAGDTGVRIWNSVPTGVVALVLLYLLRRQLASNSR